MVKQIKNNPERCVVLQKVRDCSIKSNDEKKNAVLSLCSDPAIKDE